MISSANFQQELYEEHLDEASFLYELRTEAVHDQEIAWMDLEDYDERFEAHLLGLVGGGAHAREVCVNAALAGVPGDMNVAIRLLCCETNYKALFSLLSKLDFDDYQSFMAVIDALSIGCPPHWLPPLIRFTEEDHPPLLPVMLRVLAWRRAPEASGFLQRNGDNPLLESQAPWACGRLAPQSWIGKIRVLLHEGGDTVDRSDCAIALFRIGDHHVLSRLSIAESWARIPLGLGGSQTAVHELMNTTAVSTSGLLALGLLGDIVAVPYLIQYLTVPDGAETAARALDLITGANLYEEVFIPEETEADELFEDEMAAFQKGEPVKNPNGEPAGESIVRLSENAVTWQEWWVENKSRFQAEIRYRNAQPYSPSCLLENLRSEQCPNRIRELVHHEFLIRYGCDIPFELEMPIQTQQRAILSYSQWVEENGENFKSGVWYLFGEPQLQS